MHSWQGGRVDFEDDDDGNNEGRRRGLIMTRTTTKTLTAMTPWTMKTSFVDTTTNLWPDAFLAGTGGDFNNDDDSNNNVRERGLF